MCVDINDLSYDLLKYILNFLPDKQLFVVERVSRKWQKCVLMLEQKKSLEGLDCYSDKFKSANSFYSYIINDNNIGILK